MTPLSGVHTFKYTIYALKGDLNAMVVDGTSKDFAPGNTILPKAIALNSPFPHSDPRNIDDPPCTVSIIKKQSINNTPSQWPFPLIQ